MDALGQQRTSQEHTGATLHHADASVACSQRSAAACAHCSMRPPTMEPVAPSCTSTSLACAQRERVRAGWLAQTARRAYEAGGVLVAQRFGVAERFQHGVGRLDALLRRCLRARKVGKRKRLTRAVLCAHPRSPGATADHPQVVEHQLRTTHMSPQFEGGATAASMPSQSPSCRHRFLRCAHADRQ